MAFLKRITKDDLILKKEKNVASLSGLLSDPLSYNRIFRTSISISADKLVISKKPRIDIGPAKYWHIFSCLIENIYITTREEITYLVEIIPQEGFAYPRYINELDNIAEDKSHLIFSKVIHPKMKIKHYGDSLIQYIFDINNVNQLKYVLKSFGEADQMRILGLKETKNTKKIIEMLKNNFINEDRQIDNIFEKVLFIIFFNYDSCNLFIEGIEENIIERMMGAGLTIDILEI